MSEIPEATLNRALTYLQVLEHLEHQAVIGVSSRELALAAGTTAFQVRKDLAAFGRFGRRGQGYSVAVLRRELTRTMGLNQMVRLIIIGLDSLCQAILEKVVQTAQFTVVGLFDPQAAETGRQIGGVTVLPIDRLTVFARDSALQSEVIDLAVITSFEGDVQDLANMLVTSGIPAILNFTSTPIWSPSEGLGGEVERVRVENIDVTSPLKKMAHYLFSPFASRNFLEEVI